MTVGELKKALETYLIHGEEEDLIVVLTPPADCLDWAGGVCYELAVEHPEPFTFGLRIL